MSPYKCSFRIYIIFYHRRPFNKTAATLMRPHPFSTLCTTPLGKMWVWSAPSVCRGTARWSRRDSGKSRPPMKGKGVRCSPRTDGGDILTPLYCSGLRAGLGDTPMPEQEVRSEVKIIPIYWKNIWSGWLAWCFGRSVSWPHASTSPAPLFNWH